MKRRKHITSSEGTPQKKQRGVFQNKPAAKGLRSAKRFQINNVSNIIFDGFIVALNDNGARTMWSALSKKEKDNFVSHQKKMIRLQVQKRLDVQYEEKGLPITKTIYVKYGYKGNGSEFVATERPDSSSSTGS